MPHELHGYRPREQPPLVRCEQGWLLQLWVQRRDYRGQELPTARARVQQQERLRDHHAQALQWLVTLLAHHVHLPLRVHQLQLVSHRDTLFAVSIVC